MAPRRSRTVTVTGEALDRDDDVERAATSINSGLELPANGRNWMGLTILARGPDVSTNANAPLPIATAAKRANSVELG
jgi:hypothetical protein